jgi:hypothetical protein
MYIFANINYENLIIKGKFMKLKKAPNKASEHLKKI